MVGRDEGRTGQVRRVVAVALGCVQAGTVRSGLVGLVMAVKVWSAWLSYVELR